MPIATWSAFACDAMAVVAKICGLKTPEAVTAAVEGGAGLATLPDYLAEGSDNLEIVLPDHKPADVDVFFVYPEERRHSQRIAIFRDFLLEHVAKTQF